MNDRSISLIEQYDLDVSQIHKGRGGFVIETPSKSYFLTEYTGNTKKLEFLFYIQNVMKESMICDSYLRTKENQLFVKDTDDTVYIVKELLQGREFNYKSEEDIRLVFTHLATLHHCLSTAYQSYLEEVSKQEDTFYQLTYRSYLSEFEKHTRECKHIKKYMLAQKNKTDFERLLLQYFDVFLEQAYQVTQESKKIQDTHMINELKNKHLLYHGDFQYHNILFIKEQAASIHYEHVGLGSGVKDFCYLFRKISEKNNWDISIAKTMLDYYLLSYTPSDLEWEQLKLTLAYPIKFWKIVNFYFHNKKSWISYKNMEKFESLLSQEVLKEKLLSTLFH